MLQCDLNALTIHAVMEMFDVVKMCSLTGPAPLPSVGSSISLFFNVEVRACAWRSDARDAPKSDFKARFFVSLLHLCVQYCRYTDFNLRRDIADSSIEHFERTATRGRWTRRAHSASSLRDRSNPQWWEDGLAWTPDCCLLAACLGLDTSAPAKRQHGAIGAA